MNDPKISRALFRVFALINASPKITEKTRTALRRSCVELNEKILAAKEKSPRDGRGKVPSILKRRAA